MCIIPHSSMKGFIRLPTSLSFMECLIFWALIDAPLIPARFRSFLRNPVESGGIKFGRDTSQNDSSTTTACTTSPPSPTATTSHHCCRHHPPPSLATYDDDTRYQPRGGDTTSPPQQLSVRLAMECAGDDVARCHIVQMVTMHAIVTICSVR